MPNSLPQYKPISGTGATSIKIVNLAIATADTEVSQTLENNLRSILIRSRSAATLKIAFVSGESGTNYVTIKPYAVFSTDGLALSTSTLYIQSDTSSVTVEILQTYS